MTRIQSSVGLITGINIQETVDQLIALQAQPRDRLNTKITDAKAKQTAITELTALTIGVQLGIRRLGTSDIFGSKTVSSSNSSLLTAKASTGSIAGTYQFVPVQQAQSHYLLSSGISSRTSALGAGSLSFGYDAKLNEGLELSELNGGDGVARGKIRITDRSGKSATVDLRYASTIDDVVKAINANDGASVKATLDGDTIKLVDSSGGTGNLQVAEVEGGTTAADLGLGGISVASNNATSSDLVRLFDGLEISRLNDGNGLDINGALPDLTVTFRNGSSPLSIDFNRLAKAATTSSVTTTATNGLDAQVTFTSTATGSDYDGVTIQYVDNPGVTAGNETVAYDSNSKTLTFQIDAGSTTADNLVAAVSGNSSVSALFTATIPSGGTGDGFVTVADTGVTSGGAALAARTERTLGELIDTINEADPARLQASLSANGDRIVLTDLTSGGGTFAVDSPVGGKVAEQLGLTGTAVGGTLTGGRLLGGLKSTLLRTLDGGSGIESLGSVSITNRSGTTTAVDLSTAETLDDVIRLINNSGAGVTADYSENRTGITITDNTGSTTSNLIIADGDASTTATRLGIGQSVATTKINSGSLRKQSVSRQTELTSFRGGNGVGTGTITLRDSAGTVSSLNFNTLGAKTIGDVIDAINNLSVNVEARINEAGNGLLIVDKASGSGNLIIQDVGSGTAAKSLLIAGTSTSVTLDGQPAKVIDGNTTQNVTIDADDTLDDLVKKINDLGVGVTAGVLSESSGSLRHHLTLLSGKAGKQGELTIDASGIGLSFTELASAQDAVLQVGTGTQGLLLSSSSNTFKDVIDGVDVTVQGSSKDPVSITSTTSTDSAATALQAFVDQFNRLRDKLDEYTVFDSASNTKGLLFASRETLQIESSLNRVLNSQISGLGEYSSLSQLGVTVNEFGKLAFDRNTFNERYADDPESVIEFFTNENRGFSKKLDDAVETLAGADNDSLLITSFITLTSQIETYQARVEFLTARLDRSRESLLNEFYRLESTIAKIQANQTAISSIQYIGANGSSSSSS